MDCSQTNWLSDEEYMRQFSRKIAEQRIPLVGSIDLTSRCNLDCVHCYLGSQKKRNKNRHLEMSTSTILSLIDEIAEAGCFYLLLTGGEPLIRSDFIPIFRHAKKSGLLVSVYTNATLLTEEVCELFEEFPPRLVEISLYGATEETYEKITRVKGSYTLCMNGIEKLLKHELRVGLKTMLMTLNNHEFYKIEKTARDFGVQFRFDPGINPCTDKSMSPLKFRVAPEEVVRKNFSNKAREEEWRDLLNRYKDVPDSDNIYLCAAGLTTFHVDALGRLKPCMMVQSVQHDLKDGSFHKGWQEVIPTVRGKKAHSDFTCRGCKAKVLCGYCPGFFELETGSEDVPSEYLCRLGQLNYFWLEKKSKFL